MSILFLYICNTNFKGYGKGAKGGKGGKGGKWGKGGKLGSGKIKKAFQSKSSKAGLQVILISSLLEEYIDF